MSPNQGESAARDQRSWTCPECGNVDTNVTRTGTWRTCTACRHRWDTRAEPRANSPEIPEGSTPQECLQVRPVADEANAQATVGESASDQAGGLVSYSPEGLADVTALVRRLEDRFPGLRDEPWPTVGSQIFDLAERLNLALVRASAVTADAQATPRAGGGREDSPWWNRQMVVLQEIAEGERKPTGNEPEELTPIIEAIVRGDYHRDVLDDAAKLEAENRYLREQTRCPGCGCSTPDDADANECGCDDPVCAIEVPQTLAGAYHELVRASATRAGGHAIIAIRAAFELLLKRAQGDTSAGAIMSIPARPDHDADLVLSAAIDELEDLREEVTALREERDEAREKLAAYNAPAQGVAVAWITAVGNELGKLSAFLGVGREQIPTVAEDLAIWHEHLAEAALAQRNSLARVTAERDALAAWSCATCKARFPRRIDPRLLDGVKRCSACAIAELAAAERDSALAERDALQAKVDARQANDEQLAKNLSVFGDVIAGCMPALERDAAAGNRESAEHIVRTMHFIEGLVALSEEVTDAGQ